MITEELLLHAAAQAPIIVIFVVYLLMSQKEQNKYIMERDKMFTSSLNNVSDSLKDVANALSDLKVSVASRRSE